MRQIMACTGKVRVQGTNGVFAALRVAGWAALALAIGAPINAAAQLPKIPPPEDESRAGLCNPLNICGDPGCSIVTKCAALCFGNPACAPQCGGSSCNVTCNPGPCGAGCSTRCNLALCPSNAICDPSCGGSPCNPSCEPGPCGAGCSTRCNAVLCLSNSLCDPSCGGDPCSIPCSPCDLSCPGACDSILCPGNLPDCVYGLLQVAESGVQSTIARAQQARDRAGEVVASAGEIRTHMQEGLQALTGQILSAITDAVEEAQNTIQRELDGVSDFLADGGPAEPFRQDLIMLLQKIEVIMNALYDMAGLDMKFSLARPIGLIESLPRGALFPLYRFMAAGSNFFESGIVQRLNEMADALTVLRDLLAEADEARFPDPFQECLDAESDDRYCHELLLREAYGGTCRLFLGDPPNADRVSVVKAASSVVTAVASGLKLVGKGLIAIGETGLPASEKKIGIHGYVGVHLTNNRPKQIGSFLDGVADAALFAPKYISARLKHCQAMYAANELYRNEVRLAIGRERAALKAGQIAVRDEAIAKNEEVIVRKQQEIEDALRGE